MRTKIKRVLSLLIALMLSCNILMIKPQAATSAQRQSAMIQYFQNQGATGLNGNITDVDVRLFGIFLSNFYMPFETNLTDPTTYKSLLQDACAFVMGYPDYLSMTSENKAIVEQFYSYMSGSIREVLQGTQYQLYIVHEGETVDTSKLSTIATLDRWLRDAQTADLVTEDGTVFFHYSPYDTTGSYCNLATVLALMSNGSDKVTEYLAADADESRAAPLYVTPFGDIVNDTGLVIIPGCTNPYTFSASGNVLPINNSFAMGSFISSQYKFGAGLNENSMDIPYFDTTGLQKRNNFKAPLVIGGLYTKTGFETFDRWGSLSPEKKQELLLSYISETSLTADADDFSLIVYYDADLLMDSTGSASGFWGSLFGNNIYTAKLNTLAQSIVIPDEELENVMQELYIIPTAKNGYGGYDYTKAEKVMLFKARGETKASISSSQLISSYMYDEKNYDRTKAQAHSFKPYEVIQSGLNLVECAAIYDDSWNANFFTELGYKWSVGLAEQTPKEYLGTLKSELESLLKNNVNNYNFEVFRNAVLQQVFQYQYVAANADVGASLTQAATTAEGSYLPIANTTNFWAEIFYAYMMAGFNANLPPINLDGLNEALANLLPEVAQTSDELAAENQKLANKMLKKGLELVSDTRNTAKADLVLNFADSAILAYHRKMLGINSTDIGAVDNSSKMFSGFSSPVTVPTLTELPITSTILEHYRAIYIILLLTALGLTVVLVIIHQRTLRQAIGSMLLLAFCLLLPQTFLDSTVTLTNRFTNGIYSDRFNYWAIIQHQQMLQEISVANATDDDEAALLAEALIDVRSYYNRSDGVQLRWMAAKKTQTFTDIASDTVEDASIPGLNTFKWLFSGYLKQESYSTEPMATYVYRTYTSLAQSAADSYNAISKSSGSVKTVNGVEMSPSYTAMANYGTRAANLFYRNVPLSNSLVEQAINNTNVSLTSSAGLDISGADSDDSLSAFLLYSESPFYYFYNTLRSTMMPNGTDGEFLHNFLSEEVYKSTSDNQTKGALIDFLDFEGLCSNVIPYMEGANNYVIAWTDKYGTDADGADGTSNVKQAYLNNVWNMYCPWVDSLLSTKATVEDVNMFGEHYLIENAYNAAAYSDYRPMVFSEAQRIDNGVTVDGLTTVERKLLNVQQATYEDLRYLANYANYDDEVLVTTAAMIATFNFNKEFSETTLGGFGVTLYPQGYELKNFNFDAFLRLILLNSTGISVMSTMDIYEVILDQEGLIVGLLLIMVDMFNLYVVPVCMVVFLLVAFTLGVFFTLLMIMQKPEKILLLAWNTIILPSLLFMVTTLVYACGLAVLMGEGLTAYVGAKSTAFVTNSPGVTLIIMLVLVIAMIVLYIRILSSLIKSTVIYVKNVCHTVKDGFGTFKNTVVGAVSGGAVGRYAAQRSMDAAASGAADDMDFADNGRDSADSTEDYVTQVADGVSDGTVQQQRREKVVAAEMDELASDDSRVMGTNDTDNDDNTQGTSGTSATSKSTTSGVQGNNAGNSSINKAVTKAVTNGTVGGVVSAVAQASGSSVSDMSADDNAVDVTTSGDTDSEENTTFAIDDMDDGKQEPHKWDNVVNDETVEQDVEADTDDTADIDDTFTVD